jgi:hypothetical protein
LKELPEELLWTILRFLDVRTLCTARLVCRQFRESASVHLKALQLNCTDLEQPPTSSLARLSGLTHLAVSVQKRDRLHLLSHPSIAPLITHVDVSRDAFWDVDEEEAISPLMLLPRLRSLTLPVQTHAFQLLPLTLEELHLRSPVENASPVTRLSRLTNLDINLSDGFGQSLGTLTSLLSLRSLTLCCGSSASGALSKFTMLTSLAWDVDYDHRRPGDIFLELAHLTGLAELRLSNMLREVKREHLASLSPLTTLTCLDLSDCELANDVAGSGALMPLNPLVSVHLLWVSSGMLLLPALKLTSLQSLALSYVMGDISVLHSATGLTHLEFGCRGSGSLVGLEATLARMSQLRSLSLNISGLGQPPEVFRLSTVLGALTSLTKLRYDGDFSVGTDLAAVAALSGLLSLELITPEVTPACLPALQAMSALTELTLRYTWIRLGDLTPEVRAAFNVERDRRGWPRLKLVC